MSSSLTIPTGLLPEQIKMTNYNPSSLLQQAIQSFLRAENIAISSLRNLPAELFPCLFLEAYTHRLWETLKALVQTWPFDRLPLGALFQDLVPENPSFKTVMDRIDIQLKKEVPPRCKLQVLDLRNTGHKFWSVWTGVSFRVDSQRRKLVAEGASRNEDGMPCLEVCVDLYLSQKPADQTFTYLLNWIQERKGVHLSCKKMTVYSLPSKNDRFLHAMPLCGIQEVEVHCTWPFSGLHMFSQLLGKMKSLRRLSLDITVPNAVTPEEEEKQAQSVHQLTSVFLHLCHLQELYLESPSFLHGLWTRSNEGDLTHLFQIPHIHHLKDLCLREVPLTSVSSCSQLSSLSLHGNHLMAILEKLLHCTSGLKHLSPAVSCPSGEFQPSGRSPACEEELQGHRLVSEFTSAFLQLLHLQELYLKSPFFLQGHLHQLLS
ncbi:PRAME family member 8-like [Erinaceus europaeus]|uniref:PRAME family member 8-like n=1 Tax=Erinaceus europaeus TaxID=9365 RepID=A0ABM3YBC6_ERIEU|nr:PRAME family member 8-like [Erinaceus europaeus]